MWLVHSCNLAGTPEELALFYFTLRRVASSLWLPHQDSVDLSAQLHVHAILRTEVGHRQCTAQS